MTTSPLLANISWWRLKVSRYAALGILLAPLLFALLLLSSPIVAQASSLSKPADSTSKPADSIPAVLAKPKQITWKLPKIKNQRLDAQIHSAIERAKPASVAITDYRGFFSGVIVSKEGHVLTAGHCIRPGGKYEVLLADGRKLKAKPLGRSSALDCALLKITDEAIDQARKDGKKIPWVEMADSRKLLRNQPCLSISHPGSYKPKRGVVVRFGRILGVNSRGHIHDTCLMEPGDSGGGLYDLQGRVIGIHSYIDRQLSGNFDIPINCFRDHWEAFYQGKEIRPKHPAKHLGIELESGRATKQGALVISIAKKSPAAKAGLRVDDRITQVNETQITKDFRIARLLNRLAHQPDRQVRLLVRREKKIKTLALKTEAQIQYAKVNDQTNDYQAIAKLYDQAAKAETLLDDCTVRVRSKLDGKETSLLGTVVGREGLILTKNSRVGRSPTVTDLPGNPLPATIVGRDEDNDLVLLQVKSKLRRATHRSEAPLYEEGKMLLSPRPGKATGKLSVVGSKRFRSPLRKRSGYLGVMPELQDDAVVLNRVPKGPARKAGLKSQDVVLKIGDQAITSVQQLIDVLGSHKPGEEVRVTFRRDDTKQTIRVTLGKRPQEQGGHVADAFSGGKSRRHTGFKEIFCHDAHLEPDDCGGPIFDAKGNFLGINIARYSRTRCYALSAETVWKSLEQIRKQAKKPKNQE